MLSEVEKGIMLKFFNRNGYVLDFSTEDFNSFTLASVGIPLCKYYGLSKGKSLFSFVYDAPEEDIIKIFSDLLMYYEANKDFIYEDDSYKILYVKCREIMNSKGRHSIELSAPSIKNVDYKYISEVTARAYKDIENNNFDSALTKARSLLEEVFCNVIEAQNVLPCQKGDISRLYTQVKDLYNMHSDKDTDKRIKTLLSGLEKILKSISEMRNVASDAHGVGKFRITILEYHARLFVNSAMTMAEFILSVKNNAEKCKNNH